MSDLTSKDGEEETRGEETAELEPFATNDIDGEESKVVAGQETESSDDNVTGGNVEELIPGVTLLSTITDLCEHDGLIQLGEMLVYWNIQREGETYVDTIEGDIDEEPAKSGTKENAEVLPLGEVGDKLGKGLALGGNDTVAVLYISDGLDLWRVVTLNNLGFCVLLDVLVRGRFEMRIRVILGELVLGGFGEGESSVESAKGWDEGQADEETPCAVDVVGMSAFDVFLEATEYYDGDERADEGTPTLVGEDEAKESTSSVNVGTVWRMRVSTNIKRRGVLILTRNDGGTHWVISTDTDTEDDTSDKDPCEDLITTKVGRNRDADDGGDNDQDEFPSVDGRTTVLIAQETEEELPDDTSWERVMSER